MASTRNGRPASSSNNGTAAWLRAGSLVVEAIGLGKSYGSQLVLDSVTLRIRAGEIAGTFSITTPSPGFAYGAA